MLLYLVLALLSGLAPRGVDLVSTPQDVVAITAAEAAADEELPVFLQDWHNTSHLPVSPLEEVKEERVREYKVTDAPVAVFRTCLSFLTGFLAPSECLTSPPTVVRKPRILPAPGTSRIILHQVFRI